MKKHSLVIDIVAVGSLVSLLHSSAIENSWYWSYWWMDILMHFLGGLLVGLVFLWVLNHFFSINFTGGKLLLLTIGFVLLVGIGWELFEYYMGFFVIEDPFPDTYYDLVMDLLGGIASYLYLISRKQNN